MLANTQTTTRGGDDQTADKSCSPHASCWHPAPNTQTPTRGDDQTADKSCSPHASCWHPAPNTQTPARGDVQTADKFCSPHASCWQTYRLQPEEEMTRQQTSLVLHMLHVGTQDQTPRLQPEEMSRQQMNHPQVFWWVCSSLKYKSKVMFWRPTLFITGFGKGPGPIGSRKWGPLMNFEEGGGGVMNLFVLFYRWKDSIGEKMMVSNIFHTCQHLVDWIWNHPKLAIQKCFRILSKNFHKLPLFIVLCICPSPVWNSFSLSPTDRHHWHWLQQCPQIIFQQW